jgi:MFS family permease
MRSFEQNALLPTEKRAIVSLGLLYAFRMLGLFMLLPVLALFAADFEHSTPLLIGLALGVYGLSQALLQLPFGWLSDRLGRKPIIYAGLLLFAAGSVIAAMSHSIWGVILGRALQGSGAISSTVLALLSDVTREQQRTKAMALIGMSIGLTFAAALMIGPWLSAHFGVSAIFWLTALLAIAGIFIAWRVVPEAASSVRFDGQTGTATRFVGRALSHPELMRLNAGIFSLHFALTAVFVGLPLLLRDKLGLELAQHAWVYLAVMGGGFICMVPLMIFAERSGKVRQVFLFAVGLLAISSALVAVSEHSSGSTLIAALFAFFVAFNLLEANLPSLVSKWAFPAGRGTAMGVYSTFQFMGAFLGGTAGGWMMGEFGVYGVFSLVASVALGWLLLTWGMHNPVKGRDVVLEYDAQRFSADDLLLELRRLRGVLDVTLIAGDCLAYIRVDGLVFNETSLQSYRVMESPAV